MPLKKPEITGYGMYLIRFGTDVNEIKICKIDAVTKIKNMSETFPPQSANADAEIIATGAVGPETTGCLHPATPTTNDKIIAPQIPADAPSPDAVPNAKACGSAIIPAMTAPNASPLINAKFFVRFFIFAPLPT